MSLCSDQREDGESNSGSSEAERDRYGFLLVNGDTDNDSNYPCPELVRHREKKWVTLISQWDQVLEKKHSKIKAQCQKGIPASVRSRCWPLLCGAKQRQENNKDLYKTLELSPGQQSWIDIIKRDTDRQFPFHEMFQSEDSYGQQGLLQVLKAYTQFRPDEGYCQAQGPVAAVLLMNMPMEEAFWCLVQISELYLPGYYSPLLEGVLFDAAMLFSVLKRTCPAAYKHMQRQGVEPLMFATDWLMCLYSRHLPFNTLLRVWDLFFCNGVRVLFQVAVVLVRRCLGEARQRKECEGQMETLERLRSVKKRVQHEQADVFIQEVCSVPLSLAELQRQTEKELEKWRKERPGSTFDPQDRCHGYHMIWEKGKEREKENEKKERQSGNLSASLMRSHSSLSPAILRKKWRKRGSKTETEAWEGRGLSKQDSDDEEKRRASVCGVAGELRPKTHKTPQDFNTHLQRDGNTITYTQCTSARETEPSSESTDPSASVFEEDENNAAVAAILSHSDIGEHEEETRPPSSLNDDLQSGNSQRETEKQHGTETQQDEENKDQDQKISTHQDQPEAETQQDYSQPSQLDEEEDARNKLIEETQENRSKGEETEIKPEEEVPLNINKQEEEVNLTQQEVLVNTDIQEQKIHICNCEQEQENGTNSKHREEMQMDSSKQEEEMGKNSQEQEEEIHLSSTAEEVIYNKDKQEKELNTNTCEPEEEIQEEKDMKADSSKQELKIQEEKEIKADSNEQEVEIQEEKEIKADSREQEVEIQEEKEIKADSREQEVEIQEEKEIKADSSEQEVEIQEEKEIKADSSEQEVEIQEEKEIKADSSQQEVEIQEEKEIKGDSSQQEVEIQEEKEIKADSSQQEVEVQEEKEIKADSSEQDVEIQVEKEIQADSSEQAVEIGEEKEIKADSTGQEVKEETQDEDKLVNSENEEQRLKPCLIHEEDMPKDEQQQQDDSDRMNQVEQSLEAKEETCTNVQIPDQEDADEQALSIQDLNPLKGELCESASITNKERAEQEQEGERGHSEEMETYARISDAPGEETEETIMEEEKISYAVDQEEPETAASSPDIQPETVMEHSGESETKKNSNQTQDESMKVNKISSPEHGEPDGTSGPSNPEPLQPDKKKEEAEIETNITTESNPVNPAPFGSNQHPQLRLRRSSSSQTSYPTILSKDTFRAPQQSNKQESCPQTTKTEESDIKQPAQAQSSKPEDPQKPQTQALPTQSKSDKSKRRGLFHRLRADTPSKSTIPKIVIQDFSEGGEKLSSKERRRQRRVQERKEKEEEKERKKLEKELEKEKVRERKKPQTRGKSFQVLSRKHDDDDDEVFSGRSNSQTVGRKRNSYSESYF